MELPFDGVSSLSKTQHLSPDISKRPPSKSGTHHPSKPPSLKQSGNETASLNSYVTVHDYDKNSASKSNGHNLKGEESTPMGKQYNSSRGKSDNGVKNNVLDKPAESSNQKHVTNLEENRSIKGPIEDSDNCDSRGSLETETSALGLSKASVSQVNFQLTSQPAVPLCASPQNSFYSAMPYTEAKQSFTNTEVSEYTCTVEKSGESGEATNSELIESRKTSICRGSTGSDVSDESSISSLSCAIYKPHKANDIGWEAVQAARSHYGSLDKNNFRLLKELGGGDIGKVYLAELIGTRTCFAMKVMDKAVLANRKKLPRAQTEKEILQSLDHPFLPTLYTHFEDDKVSCLVMEFCPGGDLHALRQRRSGKCFPEHEARFYVAEVLLALEYLHMLGIIYRDLKPENVLVREDGHIMLSDFDLSLRCVVCPTLVKSSNSTLETKNSGYCVQPACIEPTCVMQPDCITPACFAPRFFSGKPKKEKKPKTKSKAEVNHQLNLLPELLAEPTNARSMSFVGTHEYLAPEIIKGEGHGSAVDWWTFGIFLYELLFGRTPFKGAGNRATLFNVVGQPLRFPESPSVSFAARDLIRGLLVKEPQHRLAYRRGATEVKQHPFFQSVNWALIRCTNPPEVPKNYMMNNTPRSTKSKAPKNGKVPNVDVKSSGNYLEIDFF